MKTILPVSPVASLPRPGFGISADVRKYFARPLGTIAAILICAVCVIGQTTFNYSGSNVNYTVPAGVTKSTIANGTHFTRGVVGSYDWGTAQINTAAVQSGNDGGTITSFAIPGAAINFDGIDDYVRTSNPFYQYTNAITVEAWINTTESVWMGQSTPNVDNWSTSNVWLWHIKSFGQGMDWLVNDQGTLRGISLVTLASGWHHIATIANACGMFIYVDGVLTVSSSTGISSGIKNVSTSIIDYGKDPRYSNVISTGTDRYTAFSVDEIRIWSRSVSLQEIQAHKNCELAAGQMNGLQEYYQFNQGSAGDDNTAINTVPDASGNGRNASINNLARTGSGSNFIAPGGVTTGTNCASFSLAAITGNAPICVGGNVTLANAMPGGTWSSSAPGVASVNASGQVTGLSGGTTTISYTIDCGTAVTATVTVNALPNVTATHAGAGCAGDQIELFSSPGVSYSWIGPNGFNSNQQNPVIVNGTLANAGVYTVTVTNSNNCSASASTTVAVNALPLISASSNSPVCLGFTLNLSANGGVSYIWTGPNGFNANTQNPSLNNIVAAAAGTYSVKGTGANGCRNDATVVVTVNTLDSDGDGIPDACDDDADNDGIPNVLECNKSNFFWSNPPTVSGKTATGTINGIGYTYTSSSPVSTTTNLYAHSNFPASYGVPNANPTIQNLAITNNTITFASPMTNPVLVFASIGQAGLPVPITFGAPIQVVWSQGVVQNSSTQITGTEGYAIIRMMGTFSSIGFNYLVAENYCNFAFGADFQSCGDTDGDGIPDYLDTDSDADGCPDAIEGSMSFSMSQTSGGRLIGGVDSRGIPLLAGTGQSIGTSQNYVINCFCQPGLDETNPIAITKNITVNLDASGNATLTPSQVNNGSSDDCGIASMAVSKTSFNCSNLGVNTVTLSVTDNQGNVATGTATVTVNDVTPPTISCPTNKVLASCETVIPDYTTSAVVSDNCTAVVTQSPAAGTAIAPGTTVSVTLTAKDGSNNTTTCSFTVNRPNVTPVANNDAATVCAGSSVNINVLGNDTHPQSLALTVSDNTVPSVGTVVKNADNTFTYTAPANYSGPVTFTYTTKANDGTQAFAGNGHYYQFVSSPGITWTAARAAASAMTFNGLRGYLVTITSAAENTFMFNKVGTTAWIGGSDMGQEGVWKWMDGPEAGQQFSNQNKFGPGNCSANTPPQLTGSYHNWAPGEPNDCGGTAPGSGAENYAHFRSDGQWNDFPNTASVTGYAVEYGGLENCLPVLTATATVTITVNPVPVATIAAVGGTTACPGNTVTLNANTGSGYTYQWKLNANNISGATNSSYAAPSTGSYTVVITSNSCVSLISNAIVVTVSDVTPPTITCPDNQVLKLDASCNATLPDYRSLLTATDNCTASNALEITQSPAAGTVVSTKGAQIITFTVKDASNNTSTCTITVDKQDVTAPVIICPAPISVNNISNTCGAVVNYINPTATDNCSGAAFNFWNSGEPNDANVAHEDYLQLYTSGTWNDLPNSVLNKSIVEFNSIITTTFPNYSLIGTFGGHTYYISNGTATWTSSRTSAQAIGGDLASINTLAESQYLAPNGGSTWVGGYQDHSDPAYVEPGNASQNYGGWKWVDGTKLGSGQITITQIAGLRSGSTFPVGVTTNTFKATDESGNSSECSFTVTVVDNQRPVISCPPNQTVNATGAAGAVVTYVAPSGTDNCPGTITSLTAGLPSGATFPIGTTTVTHTATDAAGLTATCSFTVTVRGLAPIINCPGTVTASNTPGQCGANVNFAATETTGVPASTITYSIQPGTFFVVGTTSVTATATNAIGSSVCTFNVTVLDTQVPNVVTQNVTVYLDNNGQASLTAAQVNNGSSDNCGIATMTVSPNTFSCENISALVKTNSQTLISDNTWAESTTTYSTGNYCSTGIWNGVSSAMPSLGSYSIVPTINAYSVTPIPGTQGIFGLNGVRFFRKTFNLTSLSGIKATLLAAMDNGVQIFINGVAVALQGSMSTDGATFNGLSPDRVVLNSTGANVNGGAGYHSFDNITNANAASLFIIGTNEIVLALANCDGSDRGAISFKAIIENNVGGPGSVVLTVTDASGNVASANALVTVIDAIKPVISCPVNQTLNATSASGAVVTYTAPVGTDNCSVATIVRTAGPASGSTFPIGVTTVTYRATDPSGNYTDCSFTVTVSGLAPVINCPSNITINNTPGQCGANVSFAATETTGIPVSTITYSPASGSFFPIGTTTVTATATNAVGSSICTFTVTVKDIQGPVFGGSGFNVPANILTNVPEASQYQMVYKLPIPNSADWNFGSVIPYSVNNAAALASANFGRIAYYMELDNKWAWVSMDKFTSNVALTGIPTGTTIFQQKVNNLNVLSSAGAGVVNGNSIATGNIELWSYCYTTPNGIGIPGASPSVYDFGDVINGIVDCYGSFQVHNYGASQTIFAYNRWSGGSNSDLGIGNNTGNVHPDWTFMSNAANIATKNLYVFITGGIQNITVNADAGQCSAIVSVPTPQATDNCGTPTVAGVRSDNLAITAAYPKGVTTITWTATDASLNSTTSTQTVTVLDNQAPTISCPSNMNVTATSAAGAVVTYTAPIGTDNCSGATTVRTAGLASGATFPIGVTTVTHMVTDAAGKTAQCSFTVTVSGVVPVIKCPSDITVNNTPGQCGANVSFAATETTGIPASTITYSHAPGSFFPVGTTTVTATATNAVGSSICKFSVTVTDSEKPTIVSAPDQTQTADAGVCKANVTVVGPVTGDNCEVQSVTNSYTGTSNASGVYPVGTTTVTWTVTDIHGNAGIPVVQTIVVTDNTIPVITTNGDKSVNNDAGACGATVTVSASAEDNCGVGAPSGVRSDSKVLTDLYPVGTTTITWNVTDIHGNPAVAVVQTIVVTDNELPVITTNGNKSVNNDEGACDATVTVGASAEDNCGVGAPTGVRSDSKALTDPYPVGTTTITWTVTDMHGNPAVPVVQTIVVTDNTIPVITTNGDKSVNNDAGACGALVTVSASAKDNCGVGAPSGVRSDELALTDAYPVGTTTITWTVTDIHGNPAVAVVQTIVVTDNTIPVITTNGDKSVNNDAGACGAAVTVSASAADNCGVGAPSGVRSDSKALTDSYPVGTTTITWTVTDMHGNPAIPVVQTIVVTDNELPIIITNGDKSVNNDAGACGAAVTVSASAEDNCGVGAPTGVRSDSKALTDPYPVGTTTITWTVTDMHGNSAIPVVQTIVVTDNTIPVITTNGDKSVNNNAGACGAAVTVSASAADNCGVGAPSGVRSDSKALTDLYPVGTTTITWTVTDIHGNQSIATQTVTVKDNEKPTITAPASIGVYNDLGQCSAKIDIGKAITADNCGVATTVNDHASNVYPVGTTTVTWTVTDIHGNKSTATQTVTVKDNEQPTITAPAAISVNNDPGQCSAKVDIGKATTADNCGVASVVNDHPSAIYPVGTTTVTWTVTDIHGNSSTTTQTIVVRDNEKPAITAPAAVMVTNDAGKCSAVVAIGNAITADNCGVATVVNNHASNIYPVGTTTVTWTVTDVHGNAATATQTVTVSDNEAPKANCNPVTVTLVNGLAVITVADVNNNSTDNCGIASVTISKSSFNCSNLGPNNVVLTVTDIHGNTATCTAIVTVTGEIPTCSIASVPTSTTYTGGVSTNLYLGYGAQSTTLKVTVPASGAPYTYVWSGPVGLLSSSTSGSPVFTPITGGVYTFTVVTTNKYGCTTSCFITICVTDIRVPGTNGSKVYVCHLPPGNPGNSQTLSISVNAVPAHLGNHTGDRLGSCAQIPCSGPAVNAVTQSVNQSATKEAPVTTTTEEEFTVKVAPNPSTTYFTLKFASKYETPLTMRVMDASGRVIDAKSKVGSNSTIQIGHNYSSGTYYAEMIQGTKRKIVQLIKARG